MYVIVKDGVYLHGVYGLFTDKDCAIRECKSLARADEDNYHTWLVIEVPVDKVFTENYSQHPSLLDGGYTRESKALFKCEKDTCDV